MIKKLTHVKLKEVKKKRYPKLAKIHNHNRITFHPDLDHLVDAPAATSDVKEICFAGFWGCYGNKPDNSIFGPNAYPDDDNVWVRMWLYPKFHELSWPYMTGLAEFMRPLMPTVEVRYHDDKYYASWQIDRLAGQPRGQHVHLMLGLSRLTYEFYQWMPHYTTENPLETWVRLLGYANWDYDTGYGHTPFRSKDSAGLYGNGVSVEQYVDAFAEAVHNPVWLEDDPTMDYEPPVRYSSYSWTNNTPTVKEPLHQVIKEILRAHDPADTYDPFS